MPHVAGEAVVCLSSSMDYAILLQEAEYGREHRDSH